MKRFYKETAVDLGDGGHRVLLDGKPMRTPAKAVLVVPTRPLAEAIAAEWAAVPEKAEINAALLPLTRLAATGIVLGLFGAFISARWIASLLFGVQTLDPLTFTVTCLLMLGSAILASTVPASRATRVDPAVALRSE